MLAPSAIHWSEVLTHSAHHTPYGAICSRVAFSRAEVASAESLYEGTKAMLRYQPPFFPLCTQCPAVQTMLDLPGCAGSFTTVAEQTMEPSGPSKKTFPDSGALSWYFASTAFARTGSGAGSVTPLSPEMSSSSTGLSGRSASRIRSGFQRSSMIGLTKSLASRSHLSRSQFFHSPLRHLSRSIPCSFRRSFRSSGILIFSAGFRLAGALGLSPAFSSLGPQDVTVSVSAATAEAAVSSGRIDRIS